MLLKKANLPDVIYKYIGETGKNLLRVLIVAELVDPVLRFDEAGVLFA
jgi:hypothetical protein